MRVVFCWSNTSGYMAACWRELASRPGVDLHVFAYADSRETAFGEGLMEGVPWTPLPREKREDGGFIRKSVSALKPDVVVLAGWLNPAYVALAKDASMTGVRFVMGMDTPWRDTLRQRMARFALRDYLPRLSAVFVPGERAWQYARRLGIAGERIHRGMYGVDWEGWGRAAETRAKGSWPRSFLFAGRYVEEKGLDVLMDAYRIYRKEHPDSWTLQVCGMGPLAARFREVPGVTDHGFVQPERSLEIMAASGALVLPSRYDPWPLIVVESAAAGLPLLVTENCGSAVELLRPEYNGILVSPEVSAEELAVAMGRLAKQPDLATWGRRSRDLAEAYSASIWTDRWLAVLKSEIHP